MASQLKNNLRTIVAIIESLLFPGVIFGWANMVLILKNEEYFKDLCEESSGNTTSVLKTSSDDDSKKCGKQDERLALVFTISVFAFNAAGFIGGSVLDRLGTRVVRLIACFLYILTGVFAFVMEKDTANVIFPLLVCLAAAGMFVAITNFQVSVLHPKHRLTVSSALSGAIDSSSVIFLVFKAIYDAGVELRWIIVGYVAIAIVFVLSSTFLLLPKMSITAEMEAKSRTVCSYSNQAITPDVEQDQEMTSKAVGDGKELGDVQEQSALENDNATENGLGPEPPATQLEDKYSSGWRYILTAKFFWLLYFFCLVQLRLWFFVASLNSYLIYYTDDDKDKIETYSEIFGLVQFFGFFFAPFTGLIMDIQPRNTTNAFFGPMLSFIITLLLCFVLSALVLVPVLEIQYLAFVVQVAMRAFLYASLISFVLRAFPLEHYGKMYGAATLIGAMVLLLQYPIIVIMDGPANSNPYWINFAFFIASFTAMGFPLYLWLSNREREEVTAF